jgi:capsular exopolysaccharide synthesis family protein
MLDNPADLSGAAPNPNWGSRRGPEDQDRGNGRTSIPIVLAALRQRQWTLIATIVLLPLCAFIILRQITPVYTATGSLLYEPSQYTLREMQSILRADPTTEAIMASQAELLHSLHIAQTVASRGNLFDDPEFNATLRPLNLGQRFVRDISHLLGMEEAMPDDPLYGPAPNGARDRTLVAVQDALHANPVRFSHVIEITFTARNPLIAAAAVNNAMDTYIKDQYAKKHRMVDHANELLEKQAHDLRLEVRRAEEKISTYREQHTLNHGMHASTDSEQITHLTEDLVKARSDRANADARLDAARGRAGAAAQAAVAPSVVQLRARQEQLSAQIQSQQGRLGNAHPETQGFNRQFAEGQRALSAEVGRVVAAIVAEQRAATDRVATLEQNLRDAEKAADQSARAQIPLDAMSRDLDAAHAQLQAVLERMQQTAQQAAIETSEAHEISQSVPPEQPTSPRVVQTMIGVQAGAIFLGLLLVYLLQLIDSTLQSGSGIRLATGLPCFALVPEVSKRALGHLRVHDYVARRPLTAFAEQVRALRAGLWFGIDHPRIIAVTAARPSEGKSVITLALGRSAQLSGNRVLAIECDLRQPSFARRFGGNLIPGLAEILKGEAGWRNTIQQDPITGMTFIVAGKPGGDVLGLFLSEAMDKLLNDVRQGFDLVLLDAPPIQAMTEARVVAAAADATLVCVRWRSTPRNTLLNALEMLQDAHAKVIGTVLTRVDSRAHLRSGYADAEVYHRRYKSYYRG